MSAGTQMLQQSATVNAADFIWTSLSEVNSRPERGPAFDSNSTQRDGIYRAHIIYRNFLVSG